MTDTRDMPLPVKEEDSISLLDLIIFLAENRKILILGPLLVGLLTFAFTFTIQPVFTAKTVFLPPQQQQTSAAAAAMQSLGALAGLAGGNIKSPADQYVAYMQSAKLANRLIESYGLQKVYAKATLENTRKTLASNVRIEVGKRDGLITVEFDDTDPKRAAAIANSYVEELRRLTSEFVLTEAQQRRALFAKQLEQTRDKLTAAQRDLQGSGINAGALRAEPKAAADAFASLKAQVTAAQIRLQSMRNYLTEQAPEFKLAQTNLLALQAELAKVETADKNSEGGDYIGKYREFKYQETLFELFAKQFELAKLDEAREGGLIQVVDVATPPELKSKPRRSFITLAAGVASGFVLLIFVAIRQAWRKQANDAETAVKLLRLKAAFGK